MPKISSLARACALATIASAPSDRLSPQQEAAIRETLANFAAGDRYVVLLAMMQCGKTKTYHRIIRDMLAPAARYGVKRVYILCGTTDTDLYKQAEQDAVENNRTYCPNLSVYWRTTADHTEPRRYRNDDAVPDAIQIIFLQNMDSASIDITDSLIVLDESHLDQDSDQTVATFFKNHGLHLSGSNDLMRAKNTYILSVSATPFSEITLIAREKTKAKKMVRMQQPDGHFGIPQYMKAGLIRCTTSLCDPDGAEMFAREVRAGGNSYNLIRALDGRERKALFSICNNEGFEIVEYSADKETNYRQIDIAELNVAPLVPTIVFVKGRLRCGKVVPKRYVNLVWETSENPMLDTILQALPGRMCGYAAAFGERKPIIYIPRSSLEVDPATNLTQIDRYIHMFTATDADAALYITPTSGRNMKDFSYSAPHTRWPTCAIRVPTCELHASISARTSQQNKRQILETYKPAILEAINAADAPYTTYEKEQMRNTLFMSLIHGDHIAFRDFHAESQGNQKKSANLLIEATRNREAATFHFTGDGDEPLTFAKIDASLGNSHGAGHTYIVFQIKHREVLPMDLRVSHTTGKEMFNPNTLPREQRPFPIPHPPSEGEKEYMPPFYNNMGGCTISLTDAVCNSKIELMRQFICIMNVAYANYTMDSRAHMSSTIRPSATGRSLLFSKEVFENHIHLLRFLRKIAARFGATANIAIDTATTTEKDIGLREISWIFSPDA